MNLGRNVVLAFLTGAGLSIAAPLEAQYWPDSAMADLVSLTGNRPAIYEGAPARTETWSMPMWHDITAYGS